MTTAGVSFLAPASKAFVPSSVLAGCDYNAADPVNYAAGRDAGRPEASRGCYRVAEDDMTITGPRRKDPSYTLRRGFLHSSPNPAPPRPPPAPQPPHAPPPPAKPPPPPGPPPHPPPPHT